MKNYPKKLLPALAACLLALALCACSAGQGAGNDPAEESAQAETNAASDAYSEIARPWRRTPGILPRQRRKMRAAAMRRRRRRPGTPLRLLKARKEPRRRPGGEHRRQCRRGGPAAQEPADESGQTEEPQEAPPAEEPAQSEPVQTEPVQTAPEESASEDAVQTGTSQVDNAPAPETGGEDLKAIAEGLVGRPVSELYAAIGNPLSSSYAPSCLVVDGEDGELIYDGFVVYTEKGPDYETVYAVF